jgi:hypothetical protein
VVTGSFPIHKGIVMFRLEIRDAELCLGMVGLIEFIPLPGGITYKLRFEMQNGLKISESDSHGGFSNWSQTNENKVLELLDPTWTWTLFETAWQAFAEGMKRQRDLR